MYHLERRQVLHRSLPDVFPFFAQPANLERITPPWLRFRIESQDELVMREGLAIDYRVSPLLIPQRWRSKITLWDPPHRFVDEQLLGPYRHWHHLHEFREVEGGVEIVDQVSYEMPFGPLGRLAHLVLVRRQLEWIFDFREQTVKRILAPEC